MLTYSRIRNSSLLRSNGKREYAKYIVEKTKTKEMAI